jgi:antibiotic biosynthesis monooxygenase (ABM) superfamily enzyme
VLRFVARRPAGWATARRAPRTVQPKEDRLLRSSRVAASGNPTPARNTPPRHKLAVITWLAMYPTATVVQAVLGAVGLTNVALPLRTLELTMVVVPVVVFIVAPALTRLLEPWLRADPRS